MQHIQTLVGSLRGATYDWLTLSSPQHASALCAAWKPLCEESLAVDFITQSLPMTEAQALMLPPGAENEIRADIARLLGDVKLQRLYEAKPQHYGGYRDRLARCISEALGHEPHQWLYIGWILSHRGHEHSAVSLTADSLKLSADLERAFSEGSPASLIQQEESAEMHLLRQDDVSLWGWIYTVISSKAHAEPHSQAWAFLKNYLRSPDGLSHQLHEPQRP